MSYTKGMSDDTRRPLLPASSSAARIADAAEAAPALPANRDVVLIGPPTADGGGVHVLRARDERIEAGELRALREGRPITGEVVTLKPRQDNPRVCDVETSYAPPPALTPAPASGASAAPHKGPARVASNAYRERWDEIFATPPTTAKARDLN